LALFSAFFFELKPSVALPTCLPLAVERARQRCLPPLSLKNSHLSFAVLRLALASQSFLAL
jgi:hypothetical protein